MHVHGEGYCAFKPSVLIPKSYSRGVYVFGVCLAKGWGASSTYNISVHSYSAVGSLGLSPSFSN